MRLSPLIFTTLLSLALFSHSVLSEHTNHSNSNVTKKEGKCFGLALSDGADYGPYQAGVIRTLVQNITRENRTYHTVSGVGLGGINAFIMSRYEMGDEMAAVDALGKLTKS